MSSIHIQTGKTDISCKRKSLNVQSLPFKIHADCDADVDKYFNNYIKPTENGVLKCSFRGYPLLGKTVQFPKEYTALVLHESIKPATEKDDRKFYIVGQFSQMTFWNWDKAPSDNDSISQALQWIDVAKALHDPVIEEC